MDKDYVFKLVQKYLKNVPLILVGTGGSIPYGIPGMQQLATHLIGKLGEKYKAESEWVKLKKQLDDGKDLETALTGLNISEPIMQDIKRCTWELISKKDLQLFDKIVSNESIITIGKIFEYMCVPHPMHVKVITTNYDRVVEYACDQVRLSVNILTDGCYLKQINTKLSETKAKMTLLKVHGSLDWFENENGIVFSIPLQRKIPDRMNPKIIPPGSEKYRIIAQPPCRDMVHIADDFIGKADSFLCIGYGFNDDQIQANMISAIRREKPIVVVTRKLTDASLKMLHKNATKYVAIQESDTRGFTDFYFAEGKITIKGNYWKLEEFLNIIK